MDQGRNNGRQTVIVTELDLVGRNGIILIYHRDDAHMEQLLERILRQLAVQVVRHGALRHQDLRGLLIVFREQSLVGHHQLRLADRGQCLPLAECLGFDSHGLTSYGDRAGRNQNDIFTHAVDIGQCTHQLFHFIIIHITGLGMCE